MTDDLTTDCATASDQADASLSGYILVAPQESTYTYLIDRSGSVVHAWKSEYTAGLSAALTGDGHLLRAGKVQNDHMIHGTGGVIEEYDWDGNLVWQYFYSDEFEFQHHDFTRLPNGDILFIAAEVIPAKEAMALGRDPSELRDGVLIADKLLEIKPQGLHGGQVVWQWRSIDHVIQDKDPAKANYGDVAAHPELIDINYQGRPIYPDGWTHINSVDYDPKTDRILISSRNYNEIWIIDHSTTTAEAAGHTGGASDHGGDLLYRWGNPQACRAGHASDQMLFGQHNAKWIKDGLPGAGDILVFDNGADRPEGSYSRVLEITPPQNASGGCTLLPGQADGPSKAAWSYTSPDYYDFYSSKMSGAQRLPNDDTLVTVGDTGRIFEINAAGQEVWSYNTSLVMLEASPRRCETSVFYATWYPEDFAGFAGKNLSPEDPVLGALARLGTTRIVDSIKLAAICGQSPLEILATNAV